MFKFSLSYLFFIIFIKIFPHFNSSGANFLELFKFQVYISLYFISLSQEHFPLFDVVDCFIVVCDQISFNERTISHIEFFSGTFCVFVYIPICQRWIFSTCFWCFRYKSTCANVFPMGQICGMNLSTCKQFTKNIDQISHEFFIKRFSGFGICKVQTVIDGLRNDIVKLLEELFFSLDILISIKFNKIFNKLERDKIGCNSIQKEFLVLLKFRFWVHQFAYNIPKSIWNKCISMFFFQEIQPILFWFFVLREN